MRPYTSPDPLGEGEEATWAPSSSTLISGPTEGILIDALLTFSNADEIAAWAKSFGKQITGVYITHGHSDHWLGLARLLEHFPDVAGQHCESRGGRYRPGRVRHCEGASVGVASVIGLTRRPRQMSVRIGWMPW